MGRTTLGFGTKPFQGILTLHGTAGPIVPLDHAVLLDRRLREAGVESKLILVEGAGHGGFGRKSSAEGSTVEFITKHLLK